MNAHRRTDLPPSLSPPDFEVTSTSELDEVTQEINIRALYRPEGQIAPTLAESSCLTVPSPRHDNPRNNQDRVFAHPSGVLGVFDGMGKYANSAKAAGLAAQVLGEDLYKLRSDIEPTDATVCIDRSLRTAHDEITRNGKLGSTTALVAKLLYHENRTYVAYGSIGDSRLMVYRPGNNTLRDISYDETALSATKPFNKRIKDQMALAAVRTFTEYENLSLPQKVIYDTRHKIRYAAGSEVAATLQTGYREVEQDDLVIGVSDAYTDNFTQQELNDFLYQLTSDRSEGSDIHTLVGDFNGHLQEFMKSAPENHDSIRRKQDDASIAVLKVI